MKKIILVAVVLLSVVINYAYMCPANQYTMYYGPEVEEDNRLFWSYIQP